MVERWELKTQCSPQGLEGSCPHVKSLFSAHWWIIYSTISPQHMFWEVEHVAFLLPKLFWLFARLSHA